MIYNNENSQGNKPVMPLPNAEEGGPVYPGDETNDENIPAILLPTPEQNRPVFPQNRMNNGMNNGMNGNGSIIPVITLPTPEQIRPMYPENNNKNMNNGNNILSNTVGTIITTFPRPNTQCKFCKMGTANFGVVRFLNAASDYNPFTIYVNSDIFTNPLNYSEVTEYEKISSGMQSISVMAENGYTYIQKQIMVPQNQTITIAIINTESGLDLMVVNDKACSKPLQAGCIRACNLSVNSGPLNIVIGQRYIMFNNVAYMDVTEFKNIWPGDYNFYVSKSNYNNRPMGNNNMPMGNNNMPMGNNNMPMGNNNMPMGNNNTPMGNNNMPMGNNNMPMGNNNMPMGNNNMPMGNNNMPMGNSNMLISSMLTIAMNVSYTIYIFNWNLSSPDAIRALIVEEH